MKGGGSIPLEAKNGVFILRMWLPVMGVDEDDPDRGQLAPIEGDLLDEPGGDEGAAPLAPMPMEAEADDAEPLPAMAAPTRPSEQMIQEHMITHLPYRSWCQSCVRGRGKSMRHCRVEDKDQNQIPVISADYAFLGEPR